MYRIVMNDDKKFETEKLTIHFLNLINPFEMKEVYKDNVKLNMFVFLKKVRHVFSDINCPCQIHGCMTCENKECTLRNGI